MSALIWLLRFILFVVLLGLAIKNSSDVELRFFFDTHWRAPLSLVVLASLAAGVLLGFLAFLPQWIALRRQIRGLRASVRTAPEPPRAPLAAEG